MAREVTAQISRPSAAGALGPQKILVSGVTKEVRVDWDAIPRYEGETTITPTTEEQVLATRNKALLSDIIIKAIPQNYGLITWDGLGIRIS